jgi:hypothetical protein
VPAQRPSPELLLAQYEAARSRFEAAPSLATVQPCADLLARLLALPSLAPASQDALHWQLASTLLNRHLFSADRADLDRAQDLITATARGGAVPPGIEVLLGCGYRRSYLASRDPADARQAAEHLRRGVAGLASSDRSRPQAILNFLDASRELAEATGAAADLDRAIDAPRWALGLTGLGQEERSWYLSRYASRLRERYQRDRQRADLDQAIELQREALQLTQPGSEASLHYAEALTGHLTERAGSSPGPGDLEEAAAVLTGVLEGQPLSPALARIISLRGTVYRTIFARTRDLDRLDDALRDQEVALSVADLPVALQVNFRLRAANVLRDRYQETGDEADLDAALGHARAGVSLGPAGAAASRILNIRALCNLLYYEHRGDEAYLGQAISDWRGAIAAGRAHPDSDLPVALNNLGDCLIRHLREDPAYPDSLDEAVELLREAAGSHPDPQELPRILNTLGLALRYRFESGATMAELTEALSLQERAVALTAPTASFRSVRLDNLAGTLLTLGKASGDAAAVERAVTLRGQACELLGPGAHEREALYSSLAATHVEAYYLTGDNFHLDAAEAIIARLRFDQPALVGVAALVTSGLVLKELYEIRGEPALLAEAIRHYNDALGRPADATLRTRILVNLTAAMIRQAPQAHSLAEAGVVVDSAIGTLERELAAPAAAAARSEAAEALSVAYWVRGTVLHHRPDIERAVLLGEQVLSERAEDTIGRRAAGFHLALYLQARYQDNGAADDLTRGTALFRTVAATASLPRLALRAATRWGDWAQERGDLAEAAEAYRLGIAAMNRLVDTQLLRPYRETALRQAAGLVTRVAVVLAGSGQLAEAVAVLEAGRTMLANTALETARARLQALAGLGHGELLERYVSAAASASALEDTQALDQARAGASGARQVRQFDAARQQLDAVVAEIRRVPGFEDFPRPPVPGAADAARLTAPCVYLVPGLQGGAAIRVGAGRPLAWRPLPEATEAAMLSRCREWRAVTGSAAGVVTGRAGPDAVPGPDAASGPDAAPGSDIPGRADRAAGLLSLTGWLWDVAMSETAALLEAGTELILVPCGGFADLPLHAAWRPAADAADGRRFAVEDLTIRYAPSLRAALATQGRAAAMTGSSLLTVVDEALPHAQAEVDGVRSYFSPADAGPAFSSQRAEHDELVSTLGGASIVHFACHGAADGEQALNSAILACRDRAVTLADILGQHFTGMRLVTLSACESALSDRNLPDEMINLPSGLIQAGAAGAIGSLWRVDDATTAALMQRFYWEWRARKLPPADALRSAQTWLRDPARRPDTGPALPALAAGVEPSHPWYWAPFLFVGA